MKVSAWDVLKTLGERKMKIKGFNIYSNIAHVQNCKKGYGLITMTIDPETAQQLLNDTVVGKNSLVGMLVVADKAEFDAIDKELAAAEAIAKEIRDE